jgi:hypothetical protein
MPDPPMVYVTTNVEPYDPSSHKKVMGAMVPYFSTYIAPHQLVSISTYEDKHPSERGNDGQYLKNCTFLHTAGIEPVKLATIMGNNELKKVNYQYKVIDSFFDNCPETERLEMWTWAASETASICNEIGAAEGFLITSLNRTADDACTITVLSWSRNEHNAF